MSEKRIIEAPNITDPAAAATWLAADARALGFPAGEPLTYHTQSGKSSYFSVQARAGDRAPIAFDVRVSDHGVSERRFNMEATTLFLTVNADRPLSEALPTWKKQLALAQEKAGQAPTTSEQHAARIQELKGRLTAFEESGLGQTQRKEIRHKLRELGEGAWLEARARERNPSIGTRRPPVFERRKRGSAFR